MSGDIVERRGANGQLVEHLTIGGRTVEVDAEIAELVRVLNENGFPTVASCSGHSFRPASIVLADRREIIIARDFAEARRINALFPLDINGEPVSQASEIEQLRAGHAELVEALAKCHQLFHEIRMDWSDPRAECREGMEIVTAALRIVPSGGSSAKAERRTTP